MGARLKSLLAYVPLALRIGVIAMICMIAFVAYRAAASASFFEVRTVETKGAARASIKDIQAAVRRDVAETGVWRADLRQLSTHLESLPWVRTAVVTRV
jgi:cell division septal protein FtsQ